MGIEQIANKYKKTEKDPEMIWVNTGMDDLRKRECLCMNCNRKNDSPPYNSCPTAKKIYDICKENNMAMAITRCGATDEHGLMYLPLK